MNPPGFPRPGPSHQDYLISLTSERYPSLGPFLGVLFYSESFDGEGRYYLDTSPEGEGDLWSALDSANACWLALHGMTFDEIQAAAVEILATIALDEERRRISWHQERLSWHEKMRALTPDAPIILSYPEWEFHCSCLWTWGILLERYSRSNVLKNLAKSELRAILVLLDLCRLIYTRKASRENYWRLSDIDACLACIDKVIVEIRYMSEIERLAKGLEDSACAKMLIKQHDSRRAKEAAHKRHSEGYRAKQTVFDWMDKKHHTYSSLNEAAAAIVHGEVVGNSVAVIRRWLSEWRRERATDLQIDRLSK